MPFDFATSLRTIANDRVQIQTLRQRKEHLLMQVMESAEYADLVKRIDDLAAEIDEVTVYVQAAALDAYIATGNKKPAPGVQVKIMTRPVYQESEALTWCIQNLPGAVKLDARFFEKHARAVMETAPVPGVLFAFDNQAQIASDLSEYLEPVESKPEEELPF